MRHLTRERPSVLAKAILRRLPRWQRDLIETARMLGERRGVSVFLVGGPVRDLVLGRASGDLDLTVVGDAVAYAEALAAQLGTRVTIHPRFGTATLIPRGDLRLDLATARRELYAHPAALPQVFPGSIEDDLARRDFTINAMAVRLAPRGGELLDPFGGLKDLKASLLRSLHDQSYRDDPTRIFRGARYSARYRLRFSPRDRRLVRNALSEKALRRLSGDRLFRELKLLLGEPTPEAALKILQDLGVLRTLDSALALNQSAVTQMRSIRLAWERYHHLGIPPEPRLWRLYLLVLLLSVTPRARHRVGQHLGMRDSPLHALVMELKELPRLQEKLDQKQLRASRLRQLLDRASGEMRLLVWAIGERRVRKQVEQYLTRLASVRPALTGQDLRKIGFPPGPTYRRILDLLLEGRLEGRLKSRDDEINFVRQRFARPR